MATARVILLCLTVAILNACSVTAQPANGQPASLTIIPKITLSDNRGLDDCILNPTCNKVLSVGHRGTIVWAPENSLAAFQAALQMGADAVEMDLRNSKDGVLFLMHDETLDRTTNCRGKIEDKVWDEIKKCKAKAILPGIPRQPIPSFADALKSLKGKTVIDVDINTELTEKAVQEIKKRGMENQVMLLTSSLQNARSYSNNGIAFLARAKTVSDVDGFLQLPKKPAAVEVDIELLPLVQKKIHQAGSRTFVDALGPCDVIGEDCYKQLVKWRADLIQTDRLPLLAPFLRRTNR